MLQYLIQIDASEGTQRSFTFSREDIRALRNAPVGRPFDLENYICYITAEHKLSLSRRPAHIDVSTVCYRTLCRKLAEAAIDQEPT
jgi:hypothetical protein